MELRELLKLLIKSNVKKFRDKDFEIEFDFKPLADKPSEIIQVPEPPNMPPDLKGDDLMNFDKVLNWSAPPSAEQGPQADMPLTGETNL